MRVCNFTGNLGAEMTEYKVVNGEKFYLTTLTMYDHAVPLVVSEYILGDMAGKRVNVQGYIRSERSDKLFTFINASVMAAAEEDAEDLCEINIVGKVWIVKEMGLMTSCRESLPIVVRYSAPDNEVCTVHITALGADARRLHGMKLARGTDITVSGYIKPKGSVINIIGTKIAVGEDATK